jgi:hypothetical protein
MRTALIIIGKPEKENITEVKISKLHEKKMVLCKTQLSIYLYLPCIDESHISHSAENFFLWTSMM